MIAKPARQALLLLGIALLPALLAAWLHPRRPDWSALATRPPEISAHDARAQERQGPVLWVDARSRARYEEGHIPGALPVNEDDWDAQLPALVAAWRPGLPIVVYCDTQDCQASQHVARRLRSELGMTEVSVLKGGWAAWKGSKP